MSVNHGLGLTYCKLAAEAHGGRIWVEPRKDGGSVFRVLLAEGVQSGGHEEPSVTADPVGAAC